MATKKKKAAKRKFANKAAEVEFTDEEIFSIFGVGTETGSLPLRKFISGQRKINGRLYKAIEKILDNDIVTAKEINDGVPGEPPACDSGGLPGGG